MYWWDPLIKKVFFPHCQHSASLLNLNLLTSRSSSGTHLPTVNAVWNYYPWKTFSGIWNSFLYFCSFLSKKDYIKFLILHTWKGETLLFFMTISKNGLMPLWFMFLLWELSWTTEASGFLICLKSLYMKIMFIILFSWKFSRSRQMWCFSAKCT